MLAVGDYNKADLLVLRVQVQLRLQLTRRPCRFRSFVREVCPVGPPTCNPEHDRTVETANTAGSSGRRA